MTTNLKERVFTYLDDLRESGVTNMYGAGPYIQEVFPEVSQNESHILLSEWMQTFSERHGLEESDKKIAPEPVVEEKVEAPKPDFTILGDNIQLHKRDISTGMLRAMLAEVFGDSFNNPEFSYFEVDGVRVSELRSGDWIHRYASGLRFEITDRNYKNISRRVMIDKNNQLSISKMKEKVSELAAMKIEIDAAKRSDDAAYRERKNKRDSLEREINLIRDFLKSQYNNTYELTLNNLTEEQVKEVYSLVTLLREGNNE